MKKISIKTLIRIALIAICFGYSMQVKAQSKKEKKINLHSNSGSLGHHSIGWPFAFRMPYHFNVQLDANWSRNPLKPNRLFSTSLGYSNRPNWSNDIYLLFTYNPNYKFFKQQLYFSWKAGAGALVSNHQKQIYVFNNGEYKAKKWNTKTSGLIVLGLETGHNLSERIKIGAAWDWRVQIPHGGSLPFLPHSIYHIKLTYIH